MKVDLGREFLDNYSPYKKYKLYYIIQINKINVTGWEYNILVK